MAAKLLAHVSIQGQGINTPVCAQIQLKFLVMALSQINGAVAQIQRANAAASEHAKPVHKLSGHIAIIGAQDGSCGRKGYPVFKIHAANADWPEDMSVPGFH
jgi:hypothetical protein